MDARSNRAARAGSRALQPVRCHGLSGLSPIPFRPLRINWRFCHFPSPGRSTAQAASATGAAALLHRRYRRNRRCRRRPGFGMERCSARQRCLTAKGKAPDYGSRVRRYRRGRRGRQIGGAPSDGTAVVGSGAVTTCRPRSTPPAGFAGSPLSGGAELGGIVEMWKCCQ